MKEAHDDAKIIGEGSIGEWGVTYRIITLYDRVIVITSGTKRREFRHSVERDGAQVLYGYHPDTRGRVFYKLDQLLKNICKSGDLAGLLSRPDVKRFAEEFKQARRFAFEFCERHEASGLRPEEQTRVKALLVGVRKRLITHGYNEEDRDDEAAYERFVKF